MTLIVKPLFIASALALAACNGGSEEADDNAEIGASLNDKSDVAIEDVPAPVLAAARESRPDLEFKEAEKELRNGVTYYDVEGTNADGDEIELDIMQDGDGWTVVEIQRDIDYAQAPLLVRDALEQNVPGVSPGRIIESDQGDGVIIYEFFVRNTDGNEEKFEVKFDGDTAEFLTEEWKH